MPEDVKRTSLDLPLALWKRARVKAFEEGTDFRSFVIRALEQYLGARGRKSGETDWSKAKTGVPIRGKAYIVVRDPKGEKKS